MVRRSAAGRGTPRHVRFTRRNTTAAEAADVAAAASSSSTFTTKTGPAAVDTARRGRRWPVLCVSGTYVARFPGYVWSLDVWTDERAGVLAARADTGSRRPTVDGRARRNRRNPRTNGFPF